MIDAALTALATIATPGYLAYMALGVSVGLFVGILPGLGGTVGMSLALPFVFGMDPDRAIALLIGVAAVVHTADTFPSVLLGVPGSSGSHATIMDGYPMSRRGEAPRALSAAFLHRMQETFYAQGELLGVDSIAAPKYLGVGKVVVPIGLHRRVQKTYKGFWRVELPSDGFAVCDEWQK